MAQPGPFGARRGPQLLWALVTVMSGGVLVVLSYYLRDRDHWWSDATMTVGFALMLLGPIYWLTKRLEASTKQSIQQVRDEVTDEVESLRSSISDVQESVTSQLRQQDRRQRDRIMSMLGDTTFEVVADAFEAAKELGLLSEIGVRADARLTDFYLRLQRVDNGLKVHLDTRWESSVFSRTWSTGQTLDEVMLSLAEQVRSTSYWPGTEQWEFASAIEEIVDVLTTGLTIRSNGGWIANAVQKIDDEWLLSDWEAMGIHHQYQVRFDRLDELDWLSHLSGKSWTDPDNVAAMLDHARFLRTLAHAHRTSVS